MSTDTVTLTTGTGSGSLFSTYITPDAITGASAVGIASLAAVFAVAVTIVALYGLDVMSRANSQTAQTARLSSQGNITKKLHFIQSKDLI